MLVIACLNQGLAGVGSPQSKSNLFDSLMNSDLALRSYDELWSKWKWGTNLPTEQTHHEIVKFLVKGNLSTSDAWKEVLTACWLKDMALTSEDRRATIKRFLGDRLYKARPPKDEFVNAALLEKIVALYPELASQTAPSAPSQVYFRYPSTDDDLQALASLEDSLYSDEFATPLDLFRSWHAKNNQIWTMAYKDGELIGYFALLPIKDDTARNQLRQGKVHDKNLKARELYTKDEGLSQTESLYLMAVALIEEYRHKPSVYLQLLQGLAREVNLFKRKQGSRLRKLFAITNNDEANPSFRATWHTLVQIGFTIVPTTDRTDGCELFELHLTNDLDVEEFFAESIGPLGRNRGLKQLQ